MSLPSTATIPSALPAESNSTGERQAPRLPNAESIAAGVVMQTYWSSAGRTWSLAALAAHTIDAEEQDVLRELLASEEARRDLALRLLADVWHISL